MNIKRLFTISVFLILSGFVFAQKGVVNNGAKIIITGNAILDIEGGSEAGYTNETSGSDHGRIILDGKIILTGNWVNNATADSVFINPGSDGEVHFLGTSNQNIGGSGFTTFEKVVINNSGGITLGNDIGLYGNLALDNGNILLGSNNLTLHTSSSILGTPSATKMIIASGGGELRKNFSGTGSFTFPVGDNSGTNEYSPVILEFTAGTFGGDAYAGISLTDSKHANNGSLTDYLSRYWSVTQNNITTFSCNVTFEYLNADIYGTESNIYGGQWDNPNWIKLNPANTTNNQLTGTVNTFSDFTGGENSEFSISVSMTDDGLIPEAAENSEEIAVTLTNEEFIGSLDPGNWTVDNLPPGVTKGTVTRNSDTQATITLSGNRTTDYDSDITNVMVTIGADELVFSSSGLVAGTGVTLTANNDTESISISDNGINEGSEDGEEITVVLSGGTFVGALTPSNWTLSNLPGGVTKNSVTRNSATQVTITLSGNRTTDYDTDITDFTVSVTADEIDEHTGSVITDNTGVTFVANDESAAISHAGLNETNLEGANIDLTLSEETFADGTLNTTNFILNNAPPGTTVDEVTWSGIANATITLAFDGTDFDSDFTNFSVTVDASELFGLVDITTNSLSVTATNDPESITITDDGGITEGSENGEVITVTLSGGTFVDPLTTGNWTLSNLPDGVVKGTLTRTDATHATISLSGNRTTDYDSDITNLEVAIADSEIDDHSGADISVGTGVTFSAIVESATIVHAGLTESNLDGALVELELVNETFIDGTLDKTNFSLNNAPPGTTVDAVNYVNADTATVTLVFNGTDFDIDYDLSVTVDASELTGAGDVTSNILTITAVVEPATATITHAGLTEENLNTADINFALTAETFINDLTLDPANFILGNAPDGTTVNSVTWGSTTNATVTLAFDGTDFDNNITNFYIVVGAIEVSGGSSVASNTLTITATDDNETISMTDDGGISEGNENGEVITVTLSGGTFADPLTPGNWFLTNLPDGVSRGTVTRTSATSATVTLSGDRTTDYDSNITDLTLDIENAEINDHTGSDISAGTGVTFTANDESVNISHDGAGLNESNLDGAVVGIKLLNETFDDNSLDIGNFTINNVPPGTTKNGISYEGADTATITLAFDGTDFDSDYSNFSITIDAIELFGITDISSNELIISATDDVESVSMADDGDIIEGNEDGEIITVTLTGGTFVDPLITGNWFLTNLPAGITKGALIRTDATHATIALTGNRTTDYDSDITNLMLSISTDEINDTSGADITANTGVTFIANDESVTISHIGLDENNLNGAVVGIKLSNETFADNSLDLANFTINNAPPGTTKSGVSHEGTDTATITLAFNGTDFDIDYDHFSVTIDESELSGLKDITSNELVITAIDEPGVLTISHAGLTEENLDNADVSLTLDQETFADAFLISTNFTLFNVPAGVSIGTITYLSPTSATLTLVFDGADFDSDISDFNISVSAVELAGAVDLTSNNLGILATDDGESVSMTDDGAISEGTENGEVITVTLSGGTFANTLTPGNWFFTGLPDGLSILDITWNNATQAVITLSGNRTTDYDANIINATLNVDAAEVNDYTGANLTTTGIVFTAIVESSTISHAGLTENNLDGAEIGLKLTNESFNDPDLSVANFNLNNAPAGTTVNGVTYYDTDTATITLVFDGTDFDADSTNFNVTIDASELTGAGDVSSDSLTITAVAESETAEISHSGLDEINLDGAVVNLTLFNVTFADGTLDKANFTLNNTPAGTTIDAVSYISSTSATITLVFDGTDFDTDITNFSVTIDASELAIGSDITSNNLIITAIVEPESVNITDPGLTEENLDGAVITITLSNVEFIDVTLDISNFVLNNAPAGTTVGAVSYVDVDTATLTISYDGSDFDNSIENFSITVSANEITGLTDLVSNEINITAIVEGGTLAISFASGLTETNLDGAVINLVLDETTFADGSLDSSMFTLNNAPPGTTVNNVTYVSVTEATLTLEFNGIDFDTDFDNFSVTVSSVEVSGVEDITSNVLSITAVIELEDATISHVPGLTEENLDSASVHLVLSNIKFVDGTLSPVNFLLNNAPSGTWTGLVLYSNDTIADVVLVFDGTDFDSDITNFSITVTSDELVGTSSVTSNSLTISAVTENESVIISHSGLTEENLNGASIRIELDSVVFADAILSSANFSLNNAPSGTSIGSVNYINDDIADVVLVFDGTDFDTDIDNFSITVSAFELNGLDNLTSNTLSILATIEPGTLTISHTGLTEENLDGAVIGLALTEVTFIDATLNPANFTLNNAPSGTSVNSVSYTGSAAATVTLAFDGSDFDTDVTNFSITINSAELSGGTTLTGNTLTIVASVENESVTITYDGLCGDNLDGAGIEIELFNVSFADTIPDKANYTLNNAPAGTSIDTVIYSDSTHVTLTLEFDGTVFNDTIYDFSITISSIELTGLDDLASNDLVISPVTGIGPYPGAFNINMYSFENRIFIECSDPEKLKEVAIYNILGSELIRRRLDKNPVNEISLDTPGNYYIIRVYTTDNKIYSKKLLIYLR